MKLKSLVLTILLIVCCLLAVSCGNGDNADLPNDTSTDVSDTTTELNEEPTEPGTEVCPCTSTRTARENEIDSTCKTEGSYDEVVYCSVCDKELSRTSKTIEKKTEHTAATAVEENRVEATCKEEGSYDEVVYCSVCDKELSRTSKTIEKKTEHTAATAVEENRVESTCKEEGSYDEVVYCSVCDKELSRTEKTIPVKTEHTPAAAVEENRVEATCKEEGSYDEVIYCSVCNKELSRTSKTIEKEDHVYKAVVTAPTCTEKGYTTYTCRCGDTYTANEVAANGHSYDEWIVTKDPTETAKGEKRRDCKNCDHFETDVVAELSHDHSRHGVTVLEAVAPTCTATGLTEGKKCSGCGEILVAQQTVPANGHSYGEWTQTLAPTCTEKGSERRDCDDCDHYETRELSAKGHTNKDAVVENQMDATCTADGSYDSVIYCSVCNAEVSREAKTIGKLGHNYSTEWTVDLEPTCTEKGSKSHHCSRCSDKADVTEIAALGHTEVTDAAVAATCTATGLTEGTHCSVCNTVLVAQTVVPATGHSFSTAWEQNDTHHWHKAVCEHTSEISEKIEHDYGTDSICDTCGHSAITEVSSLTLNETEASIQVGDIEYLIATLLPSNATDKTVTWTSTNSSVAIVNNGTVVGVGIGDAIIIATTPNGKVAMCNVHVSEKIYYADSITLNTQSAELTVGKTITLTATITPSNTTDKTVTWATSDASVATVNNGVVTAVGAGTATITATTSNGKTATCVIIAKIIPVTDITIDQTLVYIDVDGTATISATVTPADATVTDLIWSSSDTNIATVNNGVVIGLKEGTVTITVSTKDGSISTSCTLIVENGFGLQFETYDSGYAVTACNKLTSKVVIPKTYRGKSVTAILADTFIAHGDLLEELIVPNSITYVAQGVFDNTPNLKRLIIPKSINSKSLFKSISIEHSGSADDFKPIDTDTRWLGGNGQYIDIPVPASGTDWEVWWSHIKTDSGTFVVQQNRIPASDVISWQEYDMLGDGMLIYDYPQTVILHGYIIPNGLQIIQTDSPLSVNMNEVCIEKAKTLPLCVGGVEQEALSNYLSAEDAAKLQTTGTHTITVYYYGLVETLTITITDCVEETRIENSVESTCTEEGSYDSVKYCSCCEKVLSSEHIVVPVIAHIPGETVTENSTDSNCIETGSYDEVVYCTCCGKELMRKQNTIDKKEHTPDNAIKENYNHVSCTEGGTYEDVVYCTICHSELSREIKTIPAGHVNVSGICQNCNLPFSSDGLECMLNDDGVSYTAIGYTGNDENLVIGTYHNGYINQIAENAFANCTTITTVTIGQCVANIGEKAFYNCITLEEIYFNAMAMDDVSSSNYIFAKAGQSGNGIKVIIGVNVTRLPANLFHTLISSYTPKITSVEFAEGSTCTSIGKEAFRRCNSFTSIVIPDSVTSIGSCAFYDCSGLTNITIGNGVTSIGTYAFNGCSSLTSIIIPSNVTYIGDYAFDGCSSLANITFDENSNLTKIASRAFYNCSSLVEIAIPDSVTSIGSDAFYGCSKLGSITLPFVGSTVDCCFDTDFGYIFGISSFSQSYAIPVSLKTVVITGGACIGERAFYGCSNIEYVSIGNGVTSIDNYAFDGCVSLENIVLGTGVTTIGDYAFRSTGITSIVLPEGVASIGDGAFGVCNNLESIVISSSVTSIGSDVFSSCSSLDTVYYCGTTSEWSEIAIEFNYHLENASRYYYSEAIPQVVGNYWHYVDGVPTKW